MATTHRATVSGDSDEQVWSFESFRHVTKRCNDKLINQFLGLQKANHDFEFFLKTHFICLSGNDI